MKALKYFSCIILFPLQLTFSQDFWHQTNGPYGGATVNDFLLYKESIIFLATKEGLIKSSDNGDSWIRMNSYNVTCLGVDKLNTLYFGISGHLKRSIDGGNSWTDISVPGAAIKDFVIAYKDTIFVGSWDAWDSSILKSNSINLTNGVFRSFDYGATWTLVNSGIEYPGVYEIKILSNNSILVGTSGGGVYKSTNWGDSWVPSNNGIPANSQGYRYAESLFEFAPGQVLTGTHFSIFFSSNYGDSWVFRGVGYNNNIATSFEMDDDGILFAGSDLNDGVYLSSNNGNNWSYLGLYASVRTLGWDSKNELYAGCLSRGLYRFNFVDSLWAKVYDQGYTPVEVNDLSLTNSGYLLASTEWWGLQYSSNNGDLWKRTNYSGYGPTAIESINDSIFIAADPYHTFVSTNFGNTWTTTAGFGVSASEAIYYDPITELLYVGTSTTNTNICNLYSSSDFGFTWELIYSFPVTATFQWINAIFITTTNHNILVNIRYAYWPTYSSYSRFFRSSDNGQSWELIVEQHIVYQIIEDISSDLYAIASNGLMFSKDEGTTWILRNISSPSSIAADYSGRIYNGLTYTTDKGINWIAMPITGLYNTGVNDLVINKNNRIYLGNSSGVFFGEADSIVVSAENINPVKTFHLSQNYPNPFNPSTTIQYSISSRQFVTLKVYDVLGNEIATLVNEEKQPGVYEVIFSAKVGFTSGGNAYYLPSGVYFYRLKSGSFVESKKMLLIK